LVILTQAYSHRRPCGRTAMLFSTPAAFGMGHMFEITRSVNGAKADHALFTEKESALQWLIS